MLITRDHILAAIHEIDRDQPPLRRSLGYDLVYKNRHYPPIEVMRIAHRYATGIEDWPLPGGRQTNEILEKAGFTVVSKKQMALMRNQPHDAGNVPPGQEEADAATRVVPKRAFAPPTPGPTLVAEPLPLPSPEEMPEWKGTITLSIATEDLFLPPEQVAELLQLLRTRKTLVLQGPPGTGKSLVARRLAALLTDSGRTEKLQLHPGYAYDEFILGYRPAKGGGFALQEGLLLRFARRAQLDSSHAFVLVLDELNRANLGSVLGEALTLLPPEMRGRPHALRLPAAPADAAPFWLPPNLYVVATMNTADRTLTALDYALRRRFAFATLGPAFGERFRHWLITHGVSADLTDRLRIVMTSLNESLAADPSLGDGFQIGHSYFTTPPPTDHLAWLQSIIEHDLAPLLADYFIDDPATAQRHVRKLREGLPG